MRKEYSKLLSIKKVGKSDVYDFTVENTHRILANNFYTSNCSIKTIDSEKFMDAKMEAGKVTGANISLKITDDFMESVKGDGKFTQQYPIDSKTPSITKQIDSKKLFKKIIHNAWESAEPGILFWDSIIRESIPDCYSEKGFKTTTTNPCVVGDTLVAVADGRGFVSIKQLAEEGNDVPVYAKDGEKLVIKTMRNPRLTGNNQQIYKVNIEGGHSVRVTGNHRFTLRDGSIVEAKNLKYGDSLSILSKIETSFNDAFNSKGRPESNNNYIWLNNGYSKKLIQEHGFIYEQLNGVKIEQGSVIHHIDHNRLNNSIDNLCLMTSSEHNKLHAKEMLGENNPYHKMSDEWKYNFASRKGSANHTYIDVTNDELREHAIKLTKILGRRYSNDDWSIYAKENNLPQRFSKFRSDALTGNITDLAKSVAIELGLENVDCDPRLVKTYENMLANNYNAKIVGNEVLVEKKCEMCGESFWINHNFREVSYCSITCSSKYLNTDLTIKNKRTNSVNEAYSKKGDENKDKQVKIYSDLKFKLKKDPLMKEWESECKKNNVPYRLKTKYGFESFDKLKEASELYNHKVISIEVDGYEDVYNGTVDDVHNYYIGGFEETTENGKRKLLSINTLNCGEIPLAPYDSCRLLALNLFSYVINPFTKDAYFDFDLFSKHVQYGQKIMDDIIDLEIEKIDAILVKIESDKEPTTIKYTEKNLWLKIREMAVTGRRTGLGITAEGDMLAALGLTYGTTEATEFSTKVHKTLAINAYKSSVIMAKERGSFDVFDWGLEKNNPMIKRLCEVDEWINENIKYGRRNIALLTCAPTGSLSVLTQTTSGIEPVFMPIYKRRRKINPNDKNVRVDFVDEVGDSFEEYVVIHHKFKMWMEINGYDLEEVRKYSEEQLNDLISKSPYNKATSNDVDWVEKVRMQGEIQKWVDHSISVTVNLPNDATEEIVSKVYMAAHEHGCKGITVYRDGSRNGVLITNKEKSSAEGIKETTAPKRPKKIACDVIRFQNQREKWIGFTGIYGEDKKPYEIFTGMLDSFTIPSYVENGWIIKEKDYETNISRYDFVYTDKDGYEQVVKGLNRAFNSDYWNYAKLISGILRHGMPLTSVNSLIDTLKLDDNSLSTWKSGVKRMLKKYIKDGTVAKGVKCPDCGNTKLRYQDGCCTCDCGWSKCG